MRLNRALLLALSLTTINFVVVFAVKYDKQKPVVIPSENQFTVLPIDFLPPAPVLPTSNISQTNPGYLTYAEINQQLRKWEEEAKDLVDIGNYGSSVGGQVLTYIKITNELDKTPKPKILITAAIHGNEPLSTGVIMNYIGLLLKQYNSYSLLNKEEIYFIPVVSPDSYPRSRHTEGCDPNRDFDNKTTSIVNRLQEFYLKENFCAVMSGHTFGRMYLIPWGNTTKLCPDHESYEKIIGQMARLSNYKLLRACEIYGSPIYGGELDWFYQKGAFTIVCEFGTHQNIPNSQEIDYERERTWEAFIVFLENAPKIKLKINN